MLDAVALRLLSTSAWGAKLRLFVGAGMNILDLVTDVTMVFTYYANPELRIYAAIMGGLVIFNILNQMLLCWLNWHKGPKKALFRELLLVLSGLAPGVYAARVANGDERSKHSKMTHMEVLSHARLCEMICEAIPGANEKSEAWFAHQLTHPLSLTSQPPSCRRSS